MRSTSWHRSRAYSPTAQDPVATAFALKPGMDTLTRDGTAKMAWIRSSRRTPRTTVADPCKELLGGDKRGSTERDVRVYECRTPEEMRGCPSDPESLTSDSHTTMRRYGEWPIHSTALLAEWPPGSSLRPQHGHHFPKNPHGATQSGPFNDAPERRDKSCLIWPPIHHER